MKQLVTSKSKYGRIKIYIKGILHISLPKDSNTKLQSWYESDSTYKIEIRCADETDYYGYEDIEVWKAILAEFDKLI